jgi:hypothetical protein
MWRVCLETASLNCTAAHVSLSVCMHVCACLLVLELSWRTGERGQIIAQLLVGRKSNRLWTLRAQLPVANPAAAQFTLERQYQVHTTTDPL